jgi:hypothetical protein
MCYVEPWPKPDLEACYWYHTQNVPGVGVLEGQWDLRGTFANYTGRVELAGKRLLDIGTASGFLTWEAEKAGAEVVSFDLDHARRQKLLPFKDSQFMRDREGSEQLRQKFFNGMKSSYWYMWHALNSRAKAFYGDIENLPPELGHFDVVLFGSVLEHLPDHIQAIGTAAALTDTIIITGPMSDNDLMIAEFAGRSENPEANFSFWRYSIGAYREVLAIAGFKIDQVTCAKYRCLLDGGRDIELPTLVARRA